MTDQLQPPIDVSPTLGGSAPGIALPTADPRDGEAPQPAKRPRKWLGRYGGWIVFAVFVVLWAYLILLQLLVWHYRSEVPLIFGLGSFAVAALFLYQMCYRLTPEDGMRPRFLLLVFVFGGLAAYVISRVIEPLYYAAMHGNPQNPPLGYAWLATPTEELCKIAVVILLARWIAVKNARVGLFVGGAVGFGFAAYENIEKAFAAYINAGGGLPAVDFNFDPHRILIARVVSQLALNTGIRELLTPFAHPIWTALIAAAIFAAYRGNRFRVTATVVIAFVAVAVVHALWDFLPQVFNLLLVDAPGLSLVLAYLVYAVFGAAGAIVWNVVRKRANQTAAADPPPPEPHEVLILQS